MGRPITWFEICSPAAERLRSFYAELFDWKLEEVPGMDYAVVDTGGAVGGGITGTEGSSDVVVYAEVDELEPYLRRAEELGGRVVVPVTEVPDMVTFAQVADPDGTTIGLVLADPPAPPASKWVLLYETAEAAAELVPTHFPAHSERADAFRDRGDLLWLGTFADPFRDGSMAVFRTQEAAEEFVAGDPFVLHGVVASHRILEWNEVYAG